MKNDPNFELINIFKNSEEVELYEGICNALKMANDLADHGDAWDENLKNYCGALVLGFINQKIGKLFIGCKMQMT